MSQKLLDVILLGRCSHEFSWPRRAADGQFYQVCLLCAAEYKYDWATMRRTERVKPEAGETAAPKRRQHVRKPTWVPRARRIRLDAAVRYRVKNLGTWSEGIIQNLSQSGVLLRGPQRFPENTLVEMVFEMPEEISGQKNRGPLPGSRDSYEGPERRWSGARICSLDPRLQVHPLTTKYPATPKFCSKQQPFCI